LEPIHALRDFVRDPRKRRSGQACLLRAGEVGAAGRVVSAVRAVVVAGALLAAAAADVADAGAQVRGRVGARVALGVEADLRGQVCARISAARAS
jgi:hypothetical protein